MAYGAEQNWDTASNRESEAGLHASDAERDWVERARHAYEGSNQWVQANLRDQWERNLRSFNNRHPTGSKYFSDDYKHRSKLFRPKSRAAVRKSEAACAQAFFSTQEVVDISPVDDGEEVNRVAAKFKHELLNYRLNNAPIPWFLTCIGAWQDTRTMGVCVSKTRWDYLERPVGGMEGADGTGGTDGVDGEVGIDVAGGAISTGVAGGVTNSGVAGIDRQVPRIEVVTDAPSLTLVPAENLRIDPAASWIDPIGTSPYVIELIPMFVVDVKDRMAARDPKTGMAWRVLPDGVIAKARTLEYNSTRQARENYREDSQDNRSTIQDYDVVWVHENVVRQDGEDWHYYTMGVHALLSEPVPVRRVYRHGRPWRMGFSLVETHKTYPSAVLQLGQDLQQETNEIANQRIDNVRLAMNPRHYYRRGRQVDLRALAKSVPGGPVGMMDPMTDVRTDRPPEVTASAYAEQDRLNVDIDEMFGGFSSSSVQSNRQLNETVGGMEILRTAGDTVQEYDLRVFAETWGENTLRDILALEEHYETDMEVMATAARKAGVPPQLLHPMALMYLLKVPVKVRVNVGIGSTDPTVKLKRFSTAAQITGTILGPAVAKNVDAEAVIEEVFGAAGYRDGMRFFNFEEDPKYAQLMGIIKKMQEQLDGDTPRHQADVQREALRSKTQLAKARMDNDTKLLLKRMDAAAGRQQRLEEEMAQYRREMRHLQQNLTAGLADANMRLAALTPQPQPLAAAIPPVAPVGPIAPVAPVGPQVQ